MKEKFDNIETNEEEVIRFMKDAGIIIVDRVKDGEGFKLICEDGTIMTLPDNFNIFE